MTDRMPPADRLKKIRDGIAGVRTAHGTEDRDGLYATMSTQALQQTMELLDRIDGSLGDLELDMLEETTRLDEALSKIETGVEQVITLRETSDRLETNGRPDSESLAALAAARAEGWRLGHDEACPQGQVCSAHQPLEGRTT